MDFLTALREQTKTRKSARGKRLLARLDRMNPRRRARVAKRLEEHARVHLATQGIKVGDDWGEVKERDWASFFEKLLEFLTKILPIILPFIISAPPWLLVGLAATLLRLVI